MNAIRIPLALALAGVALMTVLRADEESGTAEATSARAVNAVATIMKELRANKGTVRSGMTLAQADRATKGAALHIGERYLPLAASWLDKEQELLGTIYWDEHLEEEGKVDVIRVVLLCGAYDKKEMTKAIVATGKRIGLDMEPDEEDPDTWFDYQSKGIDLWISLGERIVVIEGNLIP
ncbi:MAG: hypothetical protein HC813_02360 [Planctomycetes bacterium]|nr:hypothetical protein [Planctomycetota bacterium]